MTIASKTILVDFRRVRNGAVFVEVCAKSSIDTSGISDFVRYGNTFFGVGNTTTESYPSSVKPVRNGLVYEDVPAKASVDATYGQGRVRLGASFVAEYTGTSVFPLVEVYPVRNGNSFNDTVAKPTINASEFDIVRFGMPFWVKYTGAPAPFNTTRFFLLF